MADCCYGYLIVALCALVLVQLCSSAPMDQYFPGDNTELTDSQRLQLLLGSEKGDDSKQFNFGDINRDVDTGLYRVMPKRFRPFRTQTRAGGVALCLWKVCPAAPWLVSKRL